MGLLSDDFNWGNALAGFFGGPDVVETLRRRQEAKAKAEAEAAEIAKVHATIDADPALSDPLAKAYAKANPKAYIENYMTRFQSRQFGASGGSIYTPGADGERQWQMAPSRHEYQGSVFDVAGGSPGQKMSVTPQHEGTQWVTPQPGTTAFGVNSFSGTPRSAEGGSAAPVAPIGGLSPELREMAADAIRQGADPAQVMKRLQDMMNGGAGAATAPRPFP